MGIARNIIIWGIPVISAVAVWFGVLSHLRVSYEWLLFGGLAIVGVGMVLLLSGVVFMGIYEI